MKIPENISRTAGKALLKLQKHSPEILIGVGIVSGVAATATAIHATLHCEQILDEHRFNMEQIEKARYVADNDDGIDYAKEDEMNDKRVVYTRTAISFVKLYLPTVMFTGISIACILSAHNILSKRNAAVVAAFAALNDKFNDYRERVRNEYGEEKDKQFMRAIDIVQTEDPETGEPGEPSKQQSMDLSGTDRFFDPMSPYWDRSNPEMNVAFVRAKTKEANDRLAINGHLFLNEVYDMFGIPHSSEGAVLGWIYDEAHPYTMVDFGIYDQTDDPWDFVRDIPWDGTHEIRLNFQDLSIIYDKI